MEKTSQTTPGRGMWNNPRNTKYSKEAQDMMKIMKQESRLTSLQRTETNKSQKTLHTTNAPSPRPVSKESVQKHLGHHPQKRSADSCRAGNSYMRERFNPGPTRDLEKEKRRLQSLMATGKDEPRITTSNKKAPAPKNPDVSEQTDRYQEVLNEIEERRQFLEDMASLGQEKQYVDIINTEISQKIRELEMLSKTDTQKTTME